ncbi:calcium-binding protein [Vibrio barjaei]|nr:calcium-binding protein [Vibrio barjaei]
MNVEHLVGGRGDDEVDFSALEVANIFDGDSEALPHAFSLNQGEEFGLVFSDDNQGAGDEQIIGSKFKDYVDARHGDDVIYGGGGDDTLRVATGNNQVYGGEGKDTISGGNHEDILKGGSGDDTITGGNYYAVYDDDLSDVHDRLWGEDGNDTLRGSGGKDRLDGGNDNDKLYGNGGDDELIGGYGSDMLNGGDGFDRASYVNSQSRLIIEANANGSVDVTEFRNGETDNDSLYNVEHIIGGRGDDRVDFSALDKAHIFDGLQSSNPHALNLTTGDEFGLIYSDDNQGAGKENIVGSRFDDYVDTRWGDDFIYGGEGNDVLRSSGGSNFIYGEGGDDTINGGNHKDVLSGGHGDDYIVAGNYYAQHDTNADDIHDSLYGDAGQDTLKGSGSNDLLEGGMDNDIIYGYEGDDLIFAGAKSSVYDTNSRQGDIIDGGSGNDMVKVIGNVEDVGIAESATMSGYYELSYTIGEHEYTDLLKDVEKVEIDGNSYVFGVDGYGLV